ncbi:efflux RND transporter permease subunit [Candidatus Nitronereus thalassa]|uniref:Efflux RND transporter permease subunit n=1 Tax=Candidatus Nitronereus thalassa TaxID=3020898 RepID=A0ABU3K9R5_9BACT|nr:efflux RND transporter permease subunit [Candidatus Nitronereus thalassa]MDT7043160.1 efflux RND transporter permease subunit [Candidatus Nitronereus thalassa]
MTPSDSHPPPSGPIAWMARHTVAANLVMLMFILGGLLVSTQIKQEVFPQFEVDVIRVSVAYPGASPEEVEQGIVLSIEDAVRGLDGVKEVTATANEGKASIEIELLTGANTNSVLQDVNNEIDSIQSFPELAEEPIISLVEVRHQVLTVMVYGDQEEQTLRDVAERIRDELLQRPGITLVELAVARPREISIEVPQQHLRSYGLTLNQIAREIGEAAIELPGGGVKTTSGEVLLRTQERRDFGREYAGIPIASTPDGATITVGDIATIKDGFEDTDEIAFYNGQRAILVNVFRVGHETPQSVSNNVYAYLDELRPELPEGLRVDIWGDQSEIYRDRMQLLLKNAFLGLILVLLLLGFFLDLRLAFWVTMGIPTSIIGAFLFIPLTDASINMISLFAFIITLGIIVDDAVMAGEIVYQKREQGMPFLQAAISGAQEIAGPITFAVLTNVAAFLPLFFVPGTMGNFMRQIPAVVVAVFFVSLIESLFVLPAHLAGTREASPLWNVLDRPRLKFSQALHSFIHERYQPFLRLVLTFRYLTVSIGLALLILAIGTVAGGHIPFSFIPGIDSELVMAQATLPYGTPMEYSREVLQRLQQGANATVEQHGGKDILRGIFGQIGSALPRVGPADAPPGLAGSHLVGMMVYLVPADKRDFSGADFSNDWRAAIGTIPGLESLTFKSETGPTGGAPIDIQLTHRSRPILETAAKELAEALSHYAGVTDIDDGVSLGKPQRSFRIKPEGRSLGLNATQLAQQVRGAFYGVEALRQQRGRNEVKVMVRLPEEERRSYFTVEHLILLTKEGGEIPLAEAAEIESGHAYTEIKRRDGRRVVAVTGDVDDQLANANTIIAELTANELDALIQKYPGLNYSLEGEQASQQESLSALAVGFALAMLLIYGLLAIPFRSYIQPLIVMLSIPFGIIGAVAGHFLLGYGLSIISLFGIIALAGVVVNDSLVLIVATNQLRDEKHIPLIEAIVQGAMRRFRPIVLTSLTTFFGLAPMIFETALQARFIIPMAISLGFGILFGTVIILTIVPSVYLIVEDFLGNHRIALEVEETPVSNIT